MISRCSLCKPTPTPNPKLTTIITSSIFHSLSPFSKTLITQKSHLLFHFQTLLTPTPLNFASQNHSPMPPSSSSKTRIVAEYAKSNRSSCKKCSKVIAAKSLRLGLVTKDPRGFDMTKWHHLGCFSDSIESVEVISGFNTLNSSEQEELKKLIGGCKDSLGKDEGTDEDGQETQLEDLNTRKRTTADTDEDGQENKSKDSKLVKRSKAAVDNVETILDIKFSLSEVKDKYKDATLQPKWKAFQTIIFLERDDGLHDSNKIAAFDFDGCLARTSVKRVGPDAWSLMYPTISDKLQSLHTDGYKLVIFTNESNIDRWKNKRQVAVDSKLGRLNNFIKKVNVPIQVFVACGYDDAKGKDPFRKPRPGMWQIMEKYFNSAISIDMDQSFYVGDAAGRECDHSDADIKFAEAIGLKFYVPEEFFRT